MTTAFGFSHSCDAIFPSLRTPGFGQESNNKSEVGWLKNQRVLSVQLLLLWYYGPHPQPDRVTTQLKAPITEVRKCSGTNSGKTRPSCGTEEDPHRAKRVPYQVCFSNDRHSRPRKSTVAAPQRIRKCLTEVLVSPKCVASDFAVQNTRTMLGPCTWRFALILLVSFLALQVRLWEAAHAR